MMLKRPTSPGNCPLILRKHAGGAGEWRKSGRGSRRESGREGACGGVADG